MYILCRTFDSNFVFWHTRCNIRDNAETVHCYELLKKKSKAKKKQQNKEQKSDSYSLLSTLNCSTRDVIETRNMPDSSQMFRALVDTVTLKINR